MGGFVEEGALETNAEAEGGIVAHLSVPSRLIYLSEDLFHDHAMTLEYIEDLYTEPSCSGTIIPVNLVRRRV